MIPLYMDYHPPSKLQPLTSNERVGKGKFIEKVRGKDGHTDRNEELV